ncbi:DUF3025 domain-containing protein [Ramlibacter sp. PS4R-6]|uniref:DUF3025 domain-containing protein n=1 Tax=Ramlibacter sp. PS4R-6 TaxID=3133438 RepID=UPI003097243B
MAIGVDWLAPWFAPWRDVGEGVLQAWRTRPLSTALGSAGAFRFVAQSDMPEGEPYEAFVFRTRSIPTRDNAHDFFNGLAWLRFPQLKQRLNEVQAGEIARDGVGGRRGPVRDAVTLLDENGAFLEAPDALRDALVARDWRRLFVDLRPLWAQAQVTVFGHALLEKLLAPRKDLTAHVWLGPADVTREALATKPFAPLPLMGIPGWSPENQNFSFYDDSLVFRAAGRRTNLQQPVRRPEP